MRITELPVAVRTEIEDLGRDLFSRVEAALAESSKLPDFVDRLDMIMHYHNLDGDRLRDDIITPLKRAVSGA